MKLICLGDSLMQENLEDTYPQTGWPQALPPYLKSDVSVKDYARNGRSTKSFLDEGRFLEALDEAEPGDVCLISFGHNDEKKEDPLRYTDPYGAYQENLAYMISKMAEKGVKSILLTSVSRLKFDEEGNLRRTHMEYPDAMRELSEKLHVPLIDLEELTYQDLKKHDIEYDKSHYMIFPKDVYPNYPEGKNDTTHMRAEGARWICQLVVPEMKKIDFVSDIFA